MRVVVDITPEARAELVALLANRMPTEADAVRFAAEFAADIKQQFEDHEGPPPGAEVLVISRWRITWWRYIGGVWIAYTRVLQPRRLFYPAVLRFTVVAFRVQPQAL